MTSCKPLLEMIINYHADCCEVCQCLYKTFTLLSTDPGGCCQILGYIFKALPCLLWLCAIFNGMCLLGRVSTAAVVTIHSNVRSMNVSTKWFGTKNVAFMMAVSMLKYYMNRSGK